MRLNIEVLYEQYVLSAVSRITKKACSKETRLKSRVAEFVT